MSKAFAGICFPPTKAGSGDISRRTESKSPDVQRDEFRLSSGRQKLQLLLSLPGEYLDKDRKHFQEANPNADGDCPVHYRRLRNMVAPCLVRMLDATLSSLVLKELIATTRDVVGIHYAWFILTPGAVDPKDTVRFVEVLVLTMEPGEAANITSAEAAPDARGIGLTLSDYPCSL